MLKELLALLELPQSRAQLRDGLQVDEETLEAMLLSLQRKGYVGLAYSQSPTCGTSCTYCSLKNLCPAAGAEPQESKVWRLSKKGEEQLKKDRR